MHLVTTVTLLCVALAARADGSAVQSPAIDASDSLCRSLDTACANLWISIQCKVTKSCVPRWELTDSSAVGNDTELCALCKKMVKQARDQLLTNETQSEIRQVVDGSCDIFLPVTPLNTLCKKLMNLFVDELNDMLVSRMNPTQVCSICGLCWASTKKAGLFDRVSYVTLSKEHEEAKCNACKNTIRRAVSFTELIPQDKVVDGFMKICEVESGNRKQQCEQFAQIYVDKLFEAVKKDTPERLCQALEQCPGDMLPASNFVNLRPYGDVQCEFCEAMLHQLIVQFNNTTTKLQVKAVLEGICRDTGSLAKECLDQVTKNFDVAYDGLLSFLNSPVVCRLLGLCSASAKFEVTATTDSLPMARLTSAISRQNNVKELECQVCRFLLRDIRALLPENKTVGFVEYAMEGVRGLIVNLQLRRKCFNLIDMYVLRDVKAIIEEANVNELRSQDQLRLPQTHLIDALQRLEAASLQEPSQNCTVCMTAMEWVFLFANGRRHRVVIKFALDEVCNKYPQILVPCKRFKDTYAPQILDLIEHHNVTTAGGVCKLLEICPNATSVFLNFTDNRKPIKISLNDVVSRDQDPSLNSVCTTCELVVSWVATMLNATTTENDIIALINEVCDSSWFPDNQRNECRNMVAAYGSLIMHLLVNAMDPHKVCTEIKFCTELTQNRGMFGLFRDEIRNKQQVDIDAAVMRTAEKPAEIGHEICEMCQLVARYLVRALNNDDAKDNIEAVLQQICLLVPADPAKCQEFVDEHIEALYKKLRKDVTVDHICKGLHVCDQPRQTTFAKTRNCVRVAGQGCILCARISEWVLAKIRSMKSKTEILAGYERLCSILPGKDRAECQNVVDTYGEIIYNLIRQNVTSEQVCKSLLYCVARQPQDKHCELSKLAATWIIDEVKNNKTEVTIVQALTEACSAISNNRTKSAKCVIMSSRTLVHLIQQDLPASEICSTLDICESRSTAAKRQLIDDNDCDVCEVVADWLVKQSLINTTEAFIIKALEQVCKVVPVDKKACQNIVDTYSFLIFQLLREKVTPVQICYVIGLCNQPRRTLTVVPKQLVFKPSCMHCNIILNRLINEIAINKLEICHELLPQRLQCQNFIDAYRDMIFQLLKQDTTYSETCWLVGLCEEARPPVRIDHSLYTSVITMVLAQIENNKTEQAILAALKNVCSSFSTDSAGQCRYFISTYGDQLLKHIGQDLDLQEAHKTITPRLTSSLMGRPLDNSQKCSMCQIMVNIIEFGLRNNNSRHEIEIFLNKVCSALSTDEQATCRTVIDVYTSYIIQIIEQLLSSKEICQALTFCPRQAINIKCEICIFILNFVEDQLGNNQTESEILEVLDKSCDLLSPQNVSECRFIVKQFVNMTITLLVQNAPPRKICEEVRQCPKALQPVKNIASISAAPLQRPDEKCSLCKWLITWIDNKLKENHTEAIIKEELDKACDLLNDSTECKEMANSYVDMIVKMLVQYVDPEHICETLGKCPKKAVLSSRVEPPCQLCKYYVHELRDRLNSSNAEAEIKSGLDQICAALSVDGKECTDLVDRYTHLLIRVILENTDLEVVCRTLKVCPTKITIRPTATNCDYCQKIVNFISMEVKNEDNDEKIIEVIEKVCDYVPIQYQENCHRMVEIDGMVIFRMIAESVDPDIICAAIKLCSTNGPDLVCTLCEYSLHYIQEKLYDNATQAEIRSELDKMCAKLKNPGMASDCKEFIDVYGSALEVIIAQKLDPSIICPTIHACPSSRGIRTGRRPSTARCHDCMSLTNANPLGYQSICVDMKSLSLHKCENAAMAGEIGRSNLTICKLIKACYAEQADKGSFTCTSRGCKYTA